VQAPEGRLRESYTFNIKNPGQLQARDKKKQRSINSAWDSIQSLQQMMRQLCALCNTLEPLPDLRFLTVRLFYHEDITPSGYEPEFFRAAAQESLDKLEFESEPAVNMKCGRVDTKTHSISLKIKAIDDVPAGGEVSHTSVQHAADGGESDDDEEEDAVESDEDTQLPKAGPAADFKIFEDLPEALLKKAAGEIYCDREVPTHNTDSLTLPFQPH